MEAPGTEHEFRLEFAWFDQAEAAAMDGRPAALRDRIAEPLPATGAPIVQRS